MVHFTPSNSTTTRTVCGFYRLLVTGKRELEEGGGGALCLCGVCVCVVVFEYVLLRLGNLI